LIVSEDVDFFRHVLPLYGSVVYVPQASVHHPPDSLRKRERARGRLLALLGL
jgi:hypothetical protein